MELGLVENFDIFLSLLKAFADQLKFSELSLDSLNSLNFCISVTIRLLLVFNKT